MVQPPIWAAENEHGAQVFHCASMAATFIGWYFVSMTPRWLPTMSTSIEAGSITTRASLAVRRNSSGLLLRRRCQAETESMTRHPVISDASSTWM